MRLFTIFRSTKSERCFVYNKYGIMLAPCASMNAVFDFFNLWCDKLGCKSVIYTQTNDKNVIRVTMK